MTNGLSVSKISSSAFLYFTIYKMTSKKHYLPTQQLLSSYIDYILILLTGVPRGLIVIADDF